MPRRKKATDEQIIAALLAGGTIKAAAAACGVSERTIYDRMYNGDFQALYKAAKADLMRQAVVSLNSQLQAAINTVAEIMSDSNNNAAVRLQAAQTIINNAAKFAQRLQANETGVTQQIDLNGWITI